MKVVPYFSHTDEDKKILLKKVADVYADSVKNYIEHLNCTKSQRLELLDDLAKLIDTSNR